MAIHPIPDHDSAYMRENHGTSCLITDPRSDKFLAQAHRESLAKLKSNKIISDAWTI